VKYTVEDLRRELADETRDLAPRVTFEQVRARAGRRRRGRLIGLFAAGLAPLLAAGTLLTLQPAGPSPSPAPTGLGMSVILPTEPGSSFGPIRPDSVVTTGLPFGDREELVFFYRDAVGGLEAGLVDRKTRKLREIGGTTAVPGQFGTIFEIDDRRGGIIDYGLFGRAGARIEVTSGGKTTQANTMSMKELPGATVFWVKRSGVLVEPTAVADAPPADTVFTARNAAGEVLRTATDIQRSDGAVNRDDRARPIGDQMRTGLTSAGGGELVLWFDGDQNAALLHAGADDGSGSIRQLRVIGSYHRPPFDIGFYGGVHRFELAGGATVLLGIYVGPAATVKMVGPNAGQQGSARWSAHPETRVFWAVGVDIGYSGVAFDAQGNILETTTFH
jgi:hypothetical protein